LRNPFSLIGHRCRLDGQKKIERGAKKSTDLFKSAFNAINIGLGFDFTGSDFAQREDNIPVVRLHKGSITFKQLFDPLRRQMNQSKAVIHFFKTIFYCDSCHITELPSIATRLISMLV
jgi:hypothetical protein